MTTGKILFSLAPSKSRFTTPHPNFSLPWPHSWSLLHLLSFWFVRLVVPIACTVKELRLGERGALPILSHVRMWSVMATLNFYLESGTLSSAWKGV